MYKFNSGHIINRGIGGGAILAALVLSANASAQVQRVGNPYTPNGSDFSVTALQGIDSSNPLGQSSSAQVNLNFEFNPSIGVTYDQGNGHLKDFGIGLYQMDHSKQVESTGLSIRYSSLVSASSANLTVEDFDLDNHATGFKPEKVSPALLIYGANNQLLASAKPSDVFSSMVAESGSKDIWDINIGSLLSSMHAHSGPVSRVVLYADASNGEKANSDPYLLKAIGKGQPVPEPATLCVLGVGALLLGRRRAKAKASA